MADFDHFRLPNALEIIGIRSGMLELFGNDPNMVKIGSFSIILNIGRHFVKSVQKLNPNAKIEKSNGSNPFKWSKEQVYQVSCFYTFLRFFSGCGRVPLALVASVLPMLFKQ